MASLYVTDIDREDWRPKTHTSFTETLTDFNIASIISTIYELISHFFMATSVQLNVH